MLSFLKRIFLRKSLFILALLVAIMLTMLVAYFKLLFSEDIYFFIAAFFAIYGALFAIINHFFPSNSIGCISECVLGSTIADFVTIASFLISIDVPDKNDPAYIDWLELYNKLTEKGFELKDQLFNFSKINDMIFKYDNNKEISEIINEIIEFAEKTKKTQPEKDNYAYITMNIINRIGKTLGIIGMREEQIYRLSVYKQLLLNLHEVYPPQMIDYVSSISYEILKNLISTFAVPDEYELMNKLYVFFILKHYAKILETITNKAKSEKIEERYIWRMEYYNDNNFRNKLINDVKEIYRKALFA